MPPHPLTIYEISDWFSKSTLFNGVFSRKNLPKILKEGAHVINLDHSKNTSSHWVVLFVKKDEVIYFDSFGVEHIPKEIKTFIKKKDVKSSIFGIQDYDSLMCGYFCILFIEFMFKGKTLNDFTNLFRPNDLKKK